MSGADRSGYMRIQILAESGIVGCVEPAGPIIDPTHAKPNAFTFFKECYVASACC